MSLRIPIAPRRGKIISSGLQRSSKEKKDMLLKFLEFSEQEGISLECLNIPAREARNSR